MDLFDFVVKGNHFYKLGELDRALFYYNMALAKGYDGLQVIKRAQKLKDEGVKPKPPIHVGKAKKLIGIKQETLRQFVFVKANYPEVLIKSLNILITCTLEPDSYSVEQDDEQVRLLKDGKPAMVFLKKDKLNNYPGCQYISEMEKYKKTQVVDGKTIQVPAKRKKYHFVIVLDTFTDLLIHLSRIKLFDQPYYEEHRQELLEYLNEEFSKYDRIDIRILPDQFVFWLETLSVLSNLIKTHVNWLEIEYTAEYVTDWLDHFLEHVEKEAIYRIDVVFMILVFLEKLYKRFPSEYQDKFEHIYEKYMVCRKFREIFGQFFTDIEQKVLSEPVLHEFEKAVKSFRQALFK
ncbi:MAG: hypothetical protein ACFFCS_05490 [Candidatus Hodarchaeota archaeon]